MTAKHVIARDHGCGGRSMAYNYKIFEAVNLLYYGIRA